MNRLCYTRVRTAVNKLFEQRLFVLITKTLSFAPDDGYPYFIDPYCVAEYGGGKASKNLTAWSVINCILEIDNWDDKDVYFDNWFTSLSLISILKEHGVRASGKVRADRLGKDLKSTNAKNAELCKCTMRKVVYLV